MEERDGTGRIRPAGPRKFSARMTAASHEHQEPFIEQFRRRLGLTTRTESSAGPSLVDAAPFSPLYAKNERIYRIADWTLLGGSGAAGPSGAAARSGVLSGDEEDWSGTAGSPSLGAASGPGRKARPARGFLPPRGVVNATPAARNKTSLPQKVSD